MDEQEKCRQENISRDLLGGIYAGNVNEWEKLCYKKWRVDKELSVQVVENGYVLPMVDMKKANNYKGGVADEKFRFVAGLFRNNPKDVDKPGAYGCAQAYTPQKEDIQQIQEECVFGGVLCFHFGHFILESMGRLWYYLRLMEQGNQEQLPYICFTVIGEKKVWFRDFFQLLGFPEDRILFAEKPLQFRRIIVPEEAVHSWHSFHPDYMLPYRKTVSAVEPSPYKKIYLTRTAFKDAGTLCMNEEYFEKFFAERGYKIISPEKYTIREQIAFMSGADVVVTTLGTISHFALFTKPGTKMISLMRSSGETLPAQCLVTEAAESCHYIVDAASNFLHESRVQGVSVIGATSHWKRFVSDFFGEECGDIIGADIYMDYLVEWLRYYGNPNKYHLIRDIDNFEMLGDAVKVLLDKKLDASKFHLGKTKKEYQKIIEDLEERKCSEKQFYQELRLQKALETRQRNCMNQLFEQVYQCGLAGEMKEFYGLEYVDRFFAESVFHGNDVMANGAICCKVHGAKYGWTENFYDSETAGKPYSGRGLEAFVLDSADNSVQFIYSAYVSGKGWGESVSNGEVAGTVGKSLPIRSIRIAVKKGSGLTTSIRYRASMNGQWSGYAYDGEELKTFDWQYIDALQIEFVLNQAQYTDRFSQLVQKIKNEKENRKRLEEQEAALGSEMVKLNGICNELMSRKNILEKEVKELKEKERMMESSFSWRVTKPFRAIAEFFGR